MLGDFHTFDLIVAGVVVVSGLLAFMHGFIREALSIATWVGAAIIAIAGYSMAQEVAQAYIPSPLIADIAAGALLFVGAFLILAIVARAIGRAFDAADGLGPINRSLGLLFGLFRGGLILTVAYLAFAWTIPERDHPDWIAGARATPILKESAALLEQALPEEWRAKGKDAARDAEEAAREAEMLRRLTAPEPKTDAESGARPSYDDSERKALDELIKDKR